MDEIRSEFPIVNEMAYFDIAYGNSLPNCVREAMILFMSISQKNGVLTTHGHTREKIQETRLSFAKLINAQTSEIAFVKNTSEGLNFAANGIKFNEGNNVVINELEHKNNIFCWLRLRKKGVEIRIVPQKNGRIEISDIANYVDSKTKVVAISSTTNLGFRFDLLKLGKICRENSSYLVVDAIQSLGIEPLDVKKAGVSILSSSSHKGLLGPHGVGFFYCSDEIIDEIESTNVAGSCYEPSNNPRNAKLKHSAERFEGGNYNEVGICGVAAALEFIGKMDMVAVAKHSFALSEKFRDGLSTLGVNVTSSPIKAERSHIVTFNIANKTIPEIIEVMEINRIRVSGHYGVIRASFAHYNTEEEVDRALTVIERIIE
jgi:selenocysteine lyase/cysteine desulfurase